LCKVAVAAAAPAASAAADQVQEVAGSVAVVRLLAVAVSVVVVPGSVAVRAAAARVSAVAALVSMEGRAVVRVREWTEAPALIVGRIAALEVLPSYEIAGGAPDGMVVRHGSIGVTAGRLVSTGETGAASRSRAGGAAFGVLAISGVASGSLRASTTQNVNG
jgi:hypothetical protein